MTSNLPETTYMWREIHEQPEAIRRALMGTRDQVQTIVSEIAQRDIDMILLVARGSSDHAALYAQYLFQYLNGIPVALATPSIITLYGAQLRLQRALVIGVSQSGVGPDVVEVVAQARAAGALTVGVTNQEHSALAAAAHHALFCAAGPERSVAATKTYTTTCAILAQLAAMLPGGEALHGPLDYLPELVAEALRSEATVGRLVERYVHARDCVVLGRGFQYSTARETALKLAETCYVVATPFSTADFRHGPLALVERGLPVIVFAPPGRTLDDTRDLLTWLRAQKADCVVIAEDARVLEMATTALPLALPQLPGNRPEVVELLAPIPYVVYGQCLALHLALHKGLNPDEPRSLTKVTRTL
jgi:glutamine---fructose-6-phosphate transaminase (isomerizing)